MPRAAKWQTASLLQPTLPRPALHAWRPHGAHGIAHLASTSRRKQAP